MSAARTISIPKYDGELLFYPDSHRYKFNGQWVPGVTSILNKTLPKFLHKWSAQQAVLEFREQRQRLDPAEFDERFEEICAAAEARHEKTKEEAGEIGSAIHQYARGWLDPEWKAPPMPELLTTNPQAMRALAAFQEWRKSVLIVEASIERMVMARPIAVAGQLVSYCGTTDFYGVIAGEFSPRRAVLDFKTGNDVYNDHWVQLGAYDEAIADEEQVYELGRTRELPWHCLVHLNKNTGDFKVHWRAPQEAALHRLIWSNCLNTYRLMARLPKMERAPRVAAA